MNISGNNSHANFIKMKTEAPNLRVKHRAIMKNYLCVQINIYIIYLA